MKDLNAMPDQLISKPENSGMELKGNLKKYFFYSELSGLYIIAFSMPSMESMKWIGLAPFLLGTAGRAVFLDRIKWRKPNTFEWFLIAPFGVTFLSTLMNWPLPKGVSRLSAKFLYLFLGWLMSVNRFTEDQMKYFLFVLIAGTMFGLSLSAFDLFSGRNPFLEFKSIPNLNRSVIYHLLTIFTMCGILLDNNGNFSVQSRR